LGAELAAGGGEWDIAEALWAGFCGRRGWRGVVFLEEVLGGEDEEEVDHGGDEEEVDDCGEEVTIADLASVDVADEVAEIGFADDGAKERIDDFFSERCDYTGEGSSDDDGDCEIHNVATQNEVAESLEHECLLEILTCMERGDRCPFRCGEYNAGGVAIARDFDAGRRG
jgi:hypothetical protein